MLKTEEIDQEHRVDTIHQFPLALGITNTLNDVVTQTEDETQS